MDPIPFGRAASKRQGFRVRPAAPSDLAAVARLAASLVRLHHRWDPLRFMLPEPLEEGYRWWLGQELANREAVVLVAERANLGVDGRTEPDKHSIGDHAQDPDPQALDAQAPGEIVGYAYGRMEERDWNALRDFCGAIHDLYVDERARRQGVARALVLELLHELEDRGAPRVVLASAWQNADAQSLFRGLGFRPTMVEMTRERDPGDGPPA